MRSGKREPWKSQSYVRAMQQFRRWTGAMFLGQPLTYDLSFKQGQMRVEAGSSHFVVPEELLTRDLGIAPLPDTVSVYVILPRSIFLIREVSIPPQTTEKEREELARLDLLRRTPFREIEVLWSIVQSKRKKGSIEQWVLKRRNLDQITKRLNKLGFDVVGCKIEGIPHTPRLSGFSRSSNPSGRIWKQINRALALFIILACFVVWVTPGIAAKRRFSEINRVLEETRETALFKREELNDQLSQQDEKRAFNQTLEAQAKLSEFLREITVVLPDTCWLSNVRSANGQFLLSGETSKSAAAIVLKLAKYPQFENPRLSGQVANTAVGNERFEISLEYSGAIK